MPFEPASQGWITKDRSAAGHIGDPRHATAAKGETLFRVVFPGRRHLSGASDPLGWPFPGWVRWTGADRRRWTEEQQRIAANLVHLRLDAAGDDAQLHGSPGAFAAGNRDQPRARAQQQGLRRHRARIWTRLRRRRRRHRSRRRPDQPALALSGCVVMLVARRMCNRLGHNAIASCSSAECCSVSSRPASGRAALVTAQRMLSRRDRPLGNSIIQSGASLGAIATPIVVLYPGDRFHGRLAAAVPRHRCGRRGLGGGLAGRRSALVTCSSQRRATPGLTTVTVISCGKRSRSRQRNNRRLPATRLSSAGFSPWRSW